MQLFALFKFGADMFIYLYLIMRFTVMNNTAYFKNVNQIYPAIFLILIFVTMFITELLFKKYRKWFTKHFNLDGRLEELEFPIFFLKGKNGLLK